MTLPLQIPTPIGDVCLEDNGSVLRSVMPPELCYKGLGFGGYSAAVAALAGFSQMPGRILRSVHTVFTGPLRSGLLDVKVRVLSAGRSCGLCEVDIEQDGAPALTALAWFADPQMVGGVSRHVTQAISYDDCVSVSWVAAVAPFLKGLNVRAVDYPLSYDEFHDGRDRVALWALPDPVAAVDHRIAEISGRLTDIMFFDAFLLDAGLRTESSPTRMVSLDLSVIWSGGQAAPEPTLLEADGRIEHKLATVQGTLRGAGGPVRASATSQCRVFRAQRERPDS
ncbi:acyl-CoA thioesterase domain-containing protein [Nocardia sp. CNY236]|uniref:acyl-CoA thioesterase domain-containing protein n=1 Tax=Nocardia sp. CNY236 TaxID=1169152 RepID=UPI0004154174|nr:acyl-CoA thioesterase domain-containing protein [Nocardia sp. CNY236]